MKAEPSRDVKKPRAPQAPTRSILLVEDDADILETVAELFEAEGYDVTTAQSAEKAVSLLDGLKGPFLVLTDLSLPGMGGEELVKRINARPDRSRFRIVVASGWDNLDRKSREMGADASIRKPFQLDQLLVTAQHHLDELEAS